MKLGDYVKVNPDKITYHEKKYINKIGRIVETFENYHGLVKVIFLGYKYDKIISKDKLVKIKLKITDIKRIVFNKN